MKSLWKTSVDRDISESELLTSVKQVNSAASFFFSLKIGNYCQISGNLILWTLETCSCCQCKIDNFPVIQSHKFESLTKLNYSQNELALHQLQPWTKIKFLSNHSTSHNDALWKGKWAKFSS